MNANRAVPMQRALRALTAALTLGASLAAAAQPDPRANLRGSITIDGSSTVAPISEAVAEEFGSVAPRVRVTVGTSGTGGGFKKFTAGETDISNASRPIKESEHAKAAENNIGYIEIPVAYDGLTIVVNKANTWTDHLTIDEIRKIFLDGRAAAQWSDVRPGWPRRPIKIYAPGTDSGTFDYFKEVIAGEEGAIRSDMTVSEDDNVLVRGVSGDENAIGFFGVAFYEENRDKLKPVPVDGGNGPVAPTSETIESGTYAPFSRPLFIYVNAKSAARPEVKAFVNYYLERAPELAAEVGYVRLPEAIYARAKANFAARKTGAAYLSPSGSKTGAPLNEVHK